MNEERAEYLVERYADLLLRIGRTWLGDLDDAKDICQTVLIKLLENPRGFPEEAQERAWVVRGAVNECKNWRKSAWFRHKVPLGEDLQLAVEEPEPEDGGVLEMVQSLPVMYREVIFLRYYEGYGVKEISALLGMPGVLADWLGQRSGTEVSEEQREVIGRLTQYVGASETVDGVTVTMDSVTVGDNTIWALLVAEGLEGLEEEEAYQRYSCRLDIWEFTPDPDTEDNTIGVGTFGVVSSRITEDGRLLMLYKYSKTFVGEDTFLTGSQVAVSLDGIYYGGQTVAAGPWEFQFDLEPVEGVSVLTLNDVQFPAWDSRGYTTVTIESVRVSATGMRCLWAEGANGMDVHLSDVSLILRDGTVVEGESVGGRYVGEMFTGQWTESVDWSAPVDLTQAEALRVGEVMIALQ